MALEYLHTTDDGWRLFKNADGFIEGFKGIGKKIVNGVVTYKDHKHIVSNQTTIEGFKKYLSGLRPKKRVKDIELKPHQLPSLFDK